MGVYVGSIGVGMSVLHPEHSDCCFVCSVQTPWLIRGLYSCGIYSYASSLYLLEWTLFQVISCILPSTTFSLFCMLLPCMFSHKFIFTISESLHPWLQVFPSLYFFSLYHSILLPSLSLCSSICFAVLSCWVYVLEPFQGVVWQSSAMFSNFLNTALSVQKLAIKSLF